MVKTTRYVRKPFYVDAIQVTEENIFEVAEWCGGSVRKTAPKSAPAGDTGEALYVKVNVAKPLNDRQTKAFVGDWILSAGNTYKVYSQKAFAGTFDEVNAVNVVKAAFSN